MLGPWFPLHVVIGLASFSIYILIILSEKRIYKKVYNLEDILIIVLLSGLLLSVIVTYSEKAFNYILAYTYIFVVAFLFLKGAFYRAVNVNTLLNVNAVAVVFIAIFAITEIGAKIFFSFDIQEFIPRVKPSQATFVSIPRAYGMATEPTILAMYFNTLGLIGVWHIKNVLQNFFLKSIIILIVFIGLISTFSAAGIASLIYSALIISSIIIIRKQKIDVVVTKLVPLVITVVIFLSLFPTVKNSISEISIVEKITLDKEAAFERIKRWKEGINEFSEAPLFGIGLGNRSMRGKGSNLNWYLFLAVESGFLPPLSIIAFLFITFFRILKSKVHGKYWFLTGFLAGAIHFTSCSTFFHPFLWTLIIVFNVYAVKSASIKYLSSKK